MVVPRRAPVKPRVLSPQSGEALPLEDEVRGLVEAGTSGAVQLLGPAGSGRTTALEHLAAILSPDANVLLLEDPAASEVMEFSSLRLVVSTASSAGELCPVATYRLAPWGNDELIEYLLAVHKERCAPVMARLRAADHPLFQGIPEVWVVVLNQLAQDESIPDARSALHRYVAAQLPDTDLLERARSACLNSLAAGDARGQQAVDQLAKPGFAKGLFCVLRHRAVQLLLASERVAADLRSDADCDCLALRLPRDLVQASAAEVVGDPRALEHLRALLAGPSWSHAMTASILHALNISWRPEPGRVPFLGGAYLEHAAWAHVQLPRAILQEADLHHADLRGANLESAFVRNANLRHARLPGACLKAIQASEADLTSADLSSVRAESAHFDGTNLEGANLEDGFLKGSIFQGANLTAANLRGADLAQSNLLGVELKEADFSGANLHAARLTGLRLREATFSGARFPEANLAGCDLEYMELAAAEFENANLEGALLTGSSMRDANFTNACLRGTGLAEIDWPGACLRGADLRGATFHMGSSRSGLVFSPIACEGSRTGFYTDDYEEQQFKAPEEIRKANLCGADLRGASIDDVDFYLVDLRGALYDPDQEQHFRRCGAILEVRV